MNKWHLMWACRGFFRGNLTNCVKVVPETAIKFWAYDFIKQRLLAYKKQQHDGHSSRSNSRIVSPAIVPTVAAFSPMATAAGGVGSGTHAASISTGLPSPTGASLITTSVLSHTAASVAAPASLSAAATAAPLRHAIGAARAAFPPTAGVTAATGGATDVTIRDKLLCGALAGMIGQLAIYPMEIVKTRLAAYSPTCRYDGIFSCLVKTFQQGGLRQLYRGLGPSLLGIIPYAGIDLALFDTLKNLYISFHYKQQQELTLRHEQHQLQERQRKRQAGAAAELHQQHLQQGRVHPGCPEQKEQQEASTQPEARTEEVALQAARSNAYGNVLLGLLRQWRATSLREEVNPAPTHDRLLLGARLRAPVTFDRVLKKEQQDHGVLGVPEQLRHMYQAQQEKIEEDKERGEKPHAQQLIQLSDNVRRRQEHENTLLASGAVRSPPVYILLLCGGISSLCGQVVAYPTALVRTRVQIDGSNGTAPKYSNSWQAARCALRDGWRGLYRGMGANLAKAVPAVSISWIVYEKSKDFIRYVVEIQEKRAPSLLH